MNLSLTQWLKLDQYESETVRNRAWRMGLILITLAISNFITLLFYTWLIILNVLPAAPITFVSTLGMLAISGIAWEILCRGRVEAAANLTSLGLLISMLSNLSYYGITTRTSTLYLVTVLFVALIGRRLVSWLYTTISITYIAVTTWIVPAPSITPILDRANAQTIAVMTLIISCLVVTIALRILILGLNRITFRVEQRLAIADMVSEASERLSSALTLQWLFDQVAEMLLDTYEQIDFIRIYTIKGNKIYLVASTDPAEVEDFDTPLQLGDPTKIGQVAASGQSMLLDMQNTDPQQTNNLLIGTRTILVLPMLLGEAASGVIELQSLRRDAWTGEEVQVIQTLANLTAAASEKTARLEEALQRADTYRQEMAEVRARQDHIERMNSEQIVQTWITYLQKASTGQNLVIDLENQSTMHDTKLTAGLKTAIMQRDVVALEDGSRAVLGVPIWSGGLVVGAMEFELEDEPSPEQLEMARQVGERLGLAADNTRLFAETQRIASREAMVNEIGANLQTASDMEAALTTAAQGLSKVLNVPRVSIRIGLPAKDGGEA